jgi:hypothetical protein
MSSINKAAGNPVLGANTTYTPSAQPQQQQPQNQGNPFQDIGNAAQNSAQADLDAALSMYDRLAAQGEQDIITATGQKESALSDIGAQETSAKKRAGSLTEEAQASATKETEKALSTSQDVERKNRNMLRALGILSSSAAGEMLARPGEEFASVKADIGQAFTKRKQQVDDWLTERVGEADRAKNDIINQFNTIVNNIRNDIRFNQRDKINAVQQAQAALQENIAQLNAQAMQFGQAAQQYTQNMAAQVAQLQLYQNPQANISGILSSLMNPGVSNYKPITVGTLQPDKDRYNTLSG